LEQTIESKVRVKKCPPRYEFDEAVRVNDVGSAFTELGPAARDDLSD